MSRSRSGSGPTEYEVRIAAEKAEVGSTIARVRAIKDGYDLGWERLVEKIRPWLMETQASADLPPGHTIDDLVQETLLSAFRFLDRFTALPDASFRGWLMKIAEHQALDSWRRFRAAKRSGGREASFAALGPDSGVDLPDARAEIPGRALEIRDEVRWLHGALARMREKHQQVIRLRLFEDLAQNEVAALMGYHRGNTIACVLHRAIQELADAYRAEFGDPEAR